jgi:hypothetical protein
MTLELNLSEKGPSLYPDLSSIEPVAFAPYKSNQKGFSSIIESAEEKNATSASMLLESDLIAEQVPSFASLEDFLKITPVDQINYYYLPQSLKSNIDQKINEILHKEGQITSKIEELKTYLNSLNQSLKEQQVPNEAVQSLSFQLKAAFFENILQMKGKTHKDFFDKKGYIDATIVDETGLLMKLCYDGLETDLGPWDINLKKIVGYGFGPLEQIGLQMDTLCDLWTKGIDPEVNEQRWQSLHWAYNQLSMYPIPHCTTPQTLNSIFNPLPSAPVEEPDESKHEAIAKVDEIVEMLNSIQISEPITLVVPERLRSFHEKKQLLKTSWTKKNNIIGEYLASFSDFKHANHTLARKAIQRNIKMSTKIHDIIHNYFWEDASEAVIKKEISHLVKKYFYPPEFDAESFFKSIEEIAIKEGRSVPADSKWGQSHACNNVERFLLAYDKYCFEHESN